MVWQVICSSHLKVYFESLHPLDQYYNCFIYDHLVAARNSVTRYAGPMVSNPNDNNEELCFPK